MSDDMERPLDEGVMPRLDPAAAEKLIDILQAGTEAREALLASLHLSVPEDSLEAHGGPVLEEGVVLGPYTLREKIGEGGMGVVFRAEQSEPVRRDVAIKCIKPGTASSTTLRRFEVERQALATMQHPGVAAVYDAGRTPATYGNQPFFVMEFVQGRAITRYCDEARLGLDDRLELFAQVCDAVQHAHYRGLLHRDLKPSNILVSKVDGRFQAKVIDFGLARAAREELDGLLAETLTREGDLIGTPMYMAPELFTGQHGVDTRTDVYALGCVLYELLSGSPPIDFGSGSTLRFSEVERRIREEIPSVPSARLRETRSTGAGDDLSTSVREVAECRASSPDQLHRRLRGELDWIARRAIAKEPQRRYASAADLGEDIRRFLRGEAVSAVPDSRYYLVSKWVQRHRATVSAVVLVFVSLVVGLVTTTWQSVRASRAEHDAQVAAREATQQAERADTQRKRAEHAEEAAQEAAAEARRRAEEAESALRVSDAVTRFVTDTFGFADPQQGGDPDLKVVDAVRMSLDEAESRLQDDPEVLARILHRLGETVWSSTRDARGIEALQRAVDVLEAHPDALSPAMRIVVRGSFAIALRQTGREREAITIYEACSREAREAGLREREAVLASNLSTAYGGLGQHDRALEYSERSLGLHRELWPDDDYRLGIALGQHASTLMSSGELDECVAMMRSSLGHLSTHFGGAHPFVANSTLQLARAQWWTGQIEEAVETARRAESMAVEVFGVDNPNLMMYRLFLANLLRDHEDYPEALTFAESAARIAEQWPAIDNKAREQVFLVRAATRTDVGRAEEALLELRSMSVALTDERFDDGHRNQYRVELGRALVLTGEVAEGSRYLDEAWAHWWSRTERKVGLPTSAGFAGSARRLFEQIGDDERAQVWAERAAQSVEALGSEQR
jgi:serine/threonine protein kinase